MQRGILSTSLSIQAEKGGKYDYRMRVNESRRLVHRYIYCEELWDGWGMCEWELSVDDLCDM